MTVSLTRKFKALSDPTRLAIIERLGASPTSVADLATLVNASQPTTSRHLRILADAGVVYSARSGRRMIYHLAGEYWLNIIAMAQE